MANYKTIGSVLKSKNTGETDYIKFSEDVTFRKGETLSLESAASIVSRAQKQMEDGIISQEEMEKRAARAEKIPLFVRFNLIKKES